LLAPFEEGGGEKAASAEQLARYFFEAFADGYGASWFLRRSLTVEQATAQKVIVSVVEQIYTGRGAPREARTKLEWVPD
jgi:hypothetical protein